MAARNKLIRSAEHIGPFMRTKPCAPSNAEPPVLRRPPSTASRTDVPNLVPRLGAQHVVVSPSAGSGQCSVAASPGSCVRGSATPLEYLRCALLGTQAHREAAAPSG